MNTALLRHLAAAPLVVAAASAHAQAPATLELKKGDHIAIVGNTLGDRLQHEGSLEAMIHQTFPDHDLVIRNLSFAADELSIRNRSDDFGSTDEWLKRVGANVVWAFWGFNESFAGPQGLDNFKADLTRFLEETKKQNYSGRGTPRIVLFSPIAHENLKSPDFPDGTENNQRIRYYAEAMAEVARAQGVQFVDLYKPSQEAYDKAAAPLTVNGIHLLDSGYTALAPAMYRGIFGKEPPAVNETLRAVVNDKNLQWFRRYRTVDSYNIVGGRSRIAYEGITNATVMAREMEMRDVLTENREKRIWSLARGSDLIVPDDNLPEHIPVPVNKPGPEPDKSFPFISGEEGLKHMTLAKGCKAELFADEKMFPELSKPVQMNWDTKGRLWVAVWPNYPERTPDSKFGDSLLIFEDTDHDGKADKCIHFIDDLNCPTGFQFYKDGVLVMQSPDMWFVRDTDGDGKADSKIRVLSGLDAADSHHETNSMVLEPGGATYLSDGVFHRSSVETMTGPVRNLDGAIYRYEPRSGRFMVHAAYGFANPHGRSFDRWGNDIITDATGNANYFAPAFTGHIDYPNKHAGMKEFWDRPSRPCPGTAFLTSHHFPEEFQGNFLNTNVIGFQGIFRAKVTEDGSGLKGETLEHLVSSDDPNFRPSGVSVAPDGSIYFLDWHNPLIGHLQHHLRDPNRDHVHGRIYRITYEGRPLNTVAKVDGEPVPALLELLKDTEDNVRTRVKLELGKRDTSEVMTALTQWVAGLDKTAPEYEHHVLEALWVHQWHNVVDIPLLERVLASPDGRARAQAVRVLGYWRDRIPAALAMVKAAAADKHPRVRLEAVRVASFFPQWEAADAAVTILTQPTDYYLDYTLSETMRQLEPQWRQAIADGKPFAADNAAGIEYVMKTLDTAALLKLPKTNGVLQTIVTRPDTAEAERAVAADALAKAKNHSVTEELCERLSALPMDAGRAFDDLARLLVRQAPDDLKAARGSLTKLAGVSSPLAAPALACLMTADGSVDAVLTESMKSPASLTDALRAVPMLADPTLRATALAKVKPLLTSLPAPLAAVLDGAQSAKGRYVRIELPQRGTLTLAEVQVYRGTKNIAQNGKASQSTTSNGGNAARAIDGNTDGSFNAGGQTHTDQERRPWWELDLGQDEPIDAVTVWNRTEGDLGKRLDGFTLTILDSRRQPVYQKTGIPAPAENVTLNLQGDPKGALVRAAITAAVATGAEGADVFATLAGLAAAGTERVAATQGLLQIPRASWTKDDAATAARALVQWATTVPATDRTAQDYIEVVQAADQLAGQMPDAEANALRRTLRDLSVSVTVLKTVREQLRYDTARIIVEAGKPFEILFLNEDLMPHNFVFAQPGSREEIGMAAQVMTPDKLDSAGRAYLPGNPKIIAATKMLEPGQSERLKLTAPAEEGSYDYICTFPGHWMVMWGKLIVTRDIDAYLKAHPQPEEVPPTFAQPK